CMQVLELPWTF
nr:immunoglobulin light chain junction region [Macaca mulatta]